MEKLCVAFDKKGSFDNTRLVERVSEIVAEMHEDGTLRTFSMKRFGGVDRTIDPTR